HRVRIAAKKARYTAQFFQSLLPPKPAARYLQRLAALQDGLGRLNDLVMARTLLAQLARDSAAPARHLAFADGYLAALSAAATSALRAPMARARRRKGPEDLIKK
ncbi:MAG: CHAD domain-containing protein, partial [Burkholderiaceae bacterium]|nr:CHAD domain-containing protein [Burkholderiaceae bacterium]